MKRNKSMNLLKKPMAVLICLLMMTSTLFVDVVSDETFGKSMLIANAAETSVEVSTLETFRAAISDETITSVTLTDSIPLSTGTYNCGNKEINTNGFSFSIASGNSVEFDNAIIKSTTVTQDGKSVFINSGTLTLDGVDISGHIKDAHRINSSVVYNDTSGSILVMKNSNIHDCKGWAVAFGQAHSDSIIVLENCSLYKNVNDNSCGSEAHGVIMESDCLFYAIDTYFCNNICFDYCSLFNTCRNLNFIGCVFYGNENTGTSGSGIFREGSYVKTAYNCIFAENKKGSDYYDVGTNAPDAFKNDIIQTATANEENKITNDVSDIFIKDESGQVQYDENGRIVINTESEDVNRVLPSGATVDYSDLDNIKVTYTDPSTGESATIDSRWTVTYYLEDDLSTVESEKVSKSASSINLKAAPARDEYRFIGWYTNSDYSGTRYSGGASFRISSNVDFYAYWIKDGALITDKTQSSSNFNITSGYLDNKKEFYTVTSGSEVTFTSKTKLTFSSGDFTETKNGDIYTYTGTVSADVTVQTAYTVSFESNGGSEITDVVFPYNTHVSLSSYEPNKSCYLFEGWYNAALTTRYTYVYVTKDVTYYAKWDENHDWIYSYEWNDDHDVCTEHRVCSKDESHTMDLVFTKHESVPATCTEQGTIEHFTCDADSGYYKLTGENKFTAVSSVTVAATGHDWGEPTYVWADNNSTCTKTAICNNDHAHKNIETVDSTYTMENGEIIHMAKFIERVNKYSHTPNVSDEGKQNSNYENSYTMTDVVTVDRAYKLRVALTWGGEKSFDWVSVWAGSHPDYTSADNYGTGIVYNSNNGKFSGGNHTDDANTYEFDIEENSVTFAFQSDASICGDGYGYYAVVTGLIDDVQTKRVAPTYTVTIPADVDLADSDCTKTVSANCDIGDQTLKVSLNSDLTMTEASDSSVTAKYTIQCGATQMTGENDTVLSVTGSDKQSVDLTFDVDKSTVVYSGSYSDTLTFNISLE